MQTAYPTARSGEQTLWDSKVSEPEHGDALMEGNSFRKPEVENLTKEVTGRFSCVYTLVKHPTDISGEPEQTELELTKPSSICRCHDLKLDRAHK